MCCALCANIFTDNLNVLVFNVSQLFVLQQTEEQSLFPTAVSEEELDKARRKSTLRRLFGSSKVFLGPGEKRPQRPDLQGGLIIQRKAAEQ